jgi:hypothetical protein
MTIFWPQLIHQRVKEYVHAQEMRIRLVKKIYINRHE